MTDVPIREDPVKRFRKLLGSLSPLNRLPKKTGETAPFLSKQSEDEKDAPRADDSPAPKPSRKKQPASKPDPETASVSKRRSYAFGPAFWTIASILSLTLNIIMAVILISLVMSVSRLGVSVSYLFDIGNNLLGLPGGLYENFEKMDRANIQTNVEVNTTIPVKFDLQLNQQTNVVLSQDVTITNALVTVNTGGLNISRANTTIVLPQGTTLPVFLSLTVPVDTTVPVTLNVPVDIPLSQTELNEPFVGLQEVIKPLYCFVDPEAVNLDGQLICQ